MRSWFAAVGVLLLSVLMLSRSVFAGDSLPSEDRDVAKVIAELRKLPKAKAELARVRFSAEVLGARTVKVWPSMDSKDTGSSNVLPSIEQEIDARACAALGPAELAAAGALDTEYAKELPLVLHAYTLGQQGKKKEASDLFAGYLDEVAPLKGECQGIHPDFANQAIAHVSFALKCMEAFTPRRDLSRHRKQVQKVMSCALNSSVVG